jgi:hypothetical protein
VNRRAEAGENSAHATGRAESGGGKGGTPRRRGVPSPFRSPLTRSSLYKSERKGERQSAHSVTASRLVLVAALTLVVLAA